MDYHEKTVLLLHEEEFRKNLDPISISNELMKMKLITNNNFVAIRDYTLESSDRRFIWRKIVDILPSVCNFVSFLQALEGCGHEALSDMLRHSLRQQIDRSLSPLSVKRAERPSSKLFINLKIHTHNNVFKDPRKYLRSLSSRYRTKYFEETDPIRQTLIGDKWAATLCAEIDSHTMLYIRRLPSHGLHDELKSLINYTSNSCMTAIAYYSRMAIAYAIAEDIDRSEDFMKEARSQSSHVGVGVEIQNMLYIDVFNLICRYEEYPSQQLREQILQKAEMGLQCLEEDEEKARYFWKRMFLLRMVYCLLGISNRTDLIHGCTVTRQCIVKAKKVMNEIDKVWESMESRRKMFYYVAKARIHELEGGKTNLETALAYMKKAIEFGQETQSGETKYSKLYDDFIRRKLSFLHESVDENMSYPTLLDNRGHPVELQAREQKDLDSPQIKNPVEN